MTKPTYYQPTPENEIAPGVYKTKIDGLFYIQYKKFQDNRGFFSDLTGIKNLEKATGKMLEVKQINLAMSKTNVIRGLHAEGWNKLVTTFSGEGMSALVDIRQDSPSFKEIEYFEFKPQEKDEHGVGLYVPMGVANSICVTKGPLLYHYAVDALYEDRDKDGDKAINLFDKELNLKWPLEREKMILSDRDLEAVSLKKLLGN